MPYRVEGSNVMHKVDDHWEVKQHCTSARNAHIVVSNLEKLDRNPKAKVFDEAKKKRKRRKPEPGLGVM